MWTMAKEPDALPRYEELGVSRLLVPLLATGAANPMEGLERIASHCT